MMNDTANFTQNITSALSLHPEAVRFFILCVAFLVAIGIAVYVYMGIAMMTIAKRLGKKNPWLVWIPVVNIFYIPVMAGYRWFYGFLLIVLGIVFLLFYSLGFMNVTGIGIFVLAMASMMLSFLT